MSIDSGSLLNMVLLRNSSSCYLFLSLVDHLDIVGYIVQNEMLVFVVDDLSVARNRT